jgi:hypothetical protein
MKGESVASFKILDVLSRRLPAEENDEYMAG